jgi:hypothetical protein
LGNGFRPLHVPSRPSKVVQNRICIGIDEMAYERYARKIDVFSKIYIDKEQIAGAKNDQDTRKSPGHINLFRALGLIMF